MKTSELLAKATEIATKLDHCKGTSFFPAGHPDDTDALPIGCCALGSLYLAQRELTGSGDPAVHYSDSAAQLLRVLVGKRPGKHHWVSDWNDLPTTTKEDVIVLLKEATEIALARENPGQTCT